MLVLFVVWWWRIWWYWTVGWLVFVLGVGRWPVRDSCCLLVGAVAFDVVWYRVGCCAVFVVVVGVGLVVVGRTVFCW